MATKAEPVPSDYPRITPYLIVSDGAKALDFYKQVFGASERMRMPAPGGKIGHAELQIGDAVIMLSDEAPEVGASAPSPSGDSQSSVFLHLYMPDVDDVVKRATAAGAKITQPVQDKFYGDRSGTFIDPFGHTWSVATRKEDLSPEEMKQRAAAAGYGG